MLGKAGAQLQQLARTIEILQDAGEHGLKAYVIDKFEEMIGSFAGTMDLFPVDHVTVISGGTSQGPISAIHPSALDVERNRQIETAVAAATQGASATSASSVEPPEGHPRNASVIS